MLNAHKKNKKGQKKKKKIRNFIKLCRDPSCEYAWILGADLLYIFRQDVVWIFFSHLYGPMLTKTKNIGKNPKFEISTIFIQLW